MCVQDFDDSLNPAIHFTSHFAALFIVARTKISVVKSCLWFKFFEDEVTSRLASIGSRASKISVRDQYMVLLSRCKDFNVSQG